MVLMVCDICYSSLNKRLQHSCKLNLLKKQNKRWSTAWVKSNSFQVLTTWLFHRTKWKRSRINKKNPDNYFHEYENIGKVSLKANQSRAARSPYISTPPPTWSDLTWALISASRSVSSSSSEQWRAVCFPLLSPEPCRRLRFQSLPTGSHCVPLRRHPLSVSGDKYPDRAAEWAAPLRPSLRSPWCFRGSLPLRRTDFQRLTHAGVSALRRQGATLREDSESVASPPRW